MNHTTKLKMSTGKWCTVWTVKSVRFGSPARFFGSQAGFLVFAAQPDLLFCLPNWGIFSPNQILRWIVLKTAPLNCSYGLKATINFNVAVHTALMGKNEDYKFQFGSAHCSHGLKWWLKISILQCTLLSWALTMTKDFYFTVHTALIGYNDD